MQIGPAPIVHMGGYSLCFCHYEPQLSEFLLVLAFLGRLNGFKYAFTTHQYFMTYFYIFNDHVVLNL